MLMPSRWLKCMLLSMDWLRFAVQLGIVVMLLWQLVQAVVVAALSELRSRFLNKNQVCPGPDKHWLFGNVSIFRTNPEQLHLRLHDLHRKFGKIVHMRFGPVLGGFDIFSIADPELVNVVMKSKSYGLSVLAKRMFKQTLGKYSIVQLEGELWKRHRRLVAPSFSLNRMRHVVEATINQTMVLVNDLKTVPCKSVECSSAMRNLTLDIFGLVGFGYNFDVQRNPNGGLTQAISDVLEHISDVATHPWPFLWPLLHPLRHFKIQQQRQILSELVKNIITQRHQDEYSTRQRQDMLSQFLSASSPENDTKYKLTEEEVHDEIITFIFAGFETTSSALSWFLYLMACMPLVQRKVQEELDNQSMDDLITEYNDLPFLVSCIKESLRFIPPANSFVRGAREDTQLGGYLIPKGSAILLNTYCLHHSPDNWTDPDSFDPRRWRGTISNYSKIYTPFGGGSRRCVGQSLALCEMKIILSLLLKHFTFTLDRSSKVMIQQKITLSPRNLNLIVTCRQPAR